MVLYLFQDYSMHLQQLRSPLFIGSLACLLVNDLILKAHFHNWFTGKLSDVAGLIAFALFFSAIFPRQRKFVFQTVAVAFCVWKSPLSQPLIDWWSTALYPIDRVVDYSDLIAVFALPIGYTTNYRREGGNRLVPLALCTTALFAFCATSRKEAPETPFIQVDRDYHYTIVKDSLIARLRASGALVEVHDGYIPQYKFRFITDTTELILIEANITIEPDLNASILHLMSFTNPTPGPAHYPPDSLISIFESRFVHPIR